MLRENTGMSVLTTREIADAVHDITPHVAELERKYLEAATALVKAEEAHDTAEAAAFLAAVEDGATTETAKRKALLATIELKSEVRRLKEQKAAARIGSEAWNRVLDVWSATSHTLNREIKAFTGAPQ